MTTIFERDIDTIIRSKENEYVFQGNFAMGLVGKKEPLTSLVRVEVKDEKLEYNYGINQAFTGPYTITGETSDVRLWMDFFSDYDERNERMYGDCEKATAFRVADVTVVENDMLIGYLKKLCWSMIENQVKGNHIVLIDPDITTVHIAVLSKKEYNFSVYYTSKAKMDLYDVNKDDAWFDPKYIPENEIVSLGNRHPGAMFYFGYSLLLYDYTQFPFDYYGYVLNPDHPCVALHGIEHYYMGRYYDCRLRSEVNVPRHLVTEPVEEVLVKSEFTKYVEFRGLYGVLRFSPRKSFALQRPGTKVIVDPLYLKGPLSIRDEKYDHPVLGELVVRFNDFGAYDFNRLIFMGQKISIMKDMGLGLAWVSQDCPTFSMNTYTVAMSEYDYHLYVYDGLRLSKEPDIHSYYTFKDTSLNFAMEDFGPLQDVISDKECESLRIAYALPPNYGYYKEYFDANRVTFTDVKLYAPDPCGTSSLKYTELRSPTDPVGQHGTNWFLTYGIPYDFPFGYVISWRDDLSSMELSHWSRAVFETYADTEMVALDS